MSDAASIDPRDLSDAELLREYQKTDGEPGNAWAMALLDEIDRRKLDT